MVTSNSVSFKGYCHLLFPATMAYQCNREVLVPCSAECCANYSKLRSCKLYVPVHDKLGGVIL